MNQPCSLLCQCLFLLPVASPCTSNLPQPDALSNTHPRPLLNLLPETKARLPLTFPDNKEPPAMTLSPALFQASMMDSDLVPSLERSKVCDSLVIDYHSCQPCSCCLLLFPVSSSFTSFSFSSPSFSPSCSHFCSHSLSLLPGCHEVTFFSTCYLPIAIYVSTWIQKLLGHEITG